MSLIPSVRTVPSVCLKPFCTKDAITHINAINFHINTYMFKGMFYKKMFTYLNIFMFTPIFHVCLHIVYTLYWKKLWQNLDRTCSADEQYFDLFNLFQAQHILVLLMNMLTAMAELCKIYFNALIQFIKMIVPPGCKWFTVFVLASTLWILTVDGLLR